MKLGVPREIRPEETRVALVPESCARLAKAGFEVAVESGAGERAGFADQSYRDAGAAVEPDAEGVYDGAGMVLKVQPPCHDARRGAHEVDAMAAGTLLLSGLVPSRELDSLRRLAERGVTAFSTDTIPRITRAQSMDVLSSMASLAGYRAVLLASVALPRYFPMLMTAAGTVLPARVFVIGAGVAGLQAIATARRLGATVEATDTRPAVKEQVESLGARFVGVEGGAAAQDARGYAAQLSPEFYERQAELIARHCASADVVITTALIGGVEAPKLVSGAMVARMRPGSVIVDLAAPGGGNCELSRPGQRVVSHGVTLLAPLNLPAEMPCHASLLLSRNLAAFVLAFARDGGFVLDLEDEIQRGAVVTHAGRVLHPAAAAALARQRSEEMEEVFA
jgi:NAD(P) transhydrogenase subunit alpha